MQLINDAWKSLGKTRLILGLKTEKGCIVLKPLLIDKKNSTSKMQKTRADKFIVSVSKIDSSKC